MKHFILLLIFNAYLVRSHSQNVGIGIPTPHASALLHISTGTDYTKGLLLTGNTHFTAATPDLGAGTRLMFYPGKGAFRAGRVTDIQWDNSKVGLYSTALGYNATSSGASGFASGEYTLAGGGSSTAMGSYSEATGFYSTAMNYLTKATGYSSIAMGNTTTAEGESSLATGSYTIAAGASSFSSGDFTTALGYASFTAGSNTSSPGQYAAALGYGTRASGEGSFATGIGTTAYPYACVALGRYNTFSGDSANWVSTDPVLLVGDGTDASNPSNLFELYKNGNLGIGGNYSNFSDARLKRNIQPLKNALQKITAVNAYQYYWKSDQVGANLQTGVLAQEIQAQMPELVTRSLKGNLMVNYNGLTPYLIEAVKELKNENQELKNDVEVLKKQMAELLRR